MIIDTKNINGFRERYSINKNGKHHGLCRSWYSNGNLYLEINCNKGEYHGIYRRWCFNGTLSLEANFKNGKYQGF